MMGVVVIPCYSDLDGGVGESADMVEWGCVAHW